MRTYLYVISGTFLLMTKTAVGDYPVAGIEPFQRPTDAPKIEWVHHSKAWYQVALTGINQPYSPSLNFLDNQGNWYTPFNHPGATGRYDLRKWHQ